MALLALWNLSHRVCAKRLREMIPLLLPAEIRHGVVEDAGDLSNLLLKVSSATIDRLLASAPWIHPFRPPTVSPYIISQLVGSPRKIRNEPGLWLNAYVE